ncbi:hypothetical protein GCM10020331_074380 [Ectobacillus funiculus]
MPWNCQKEHKKPKTTAVSMNMMPVVALSVSSSKEDIVELTSTVEESLLPKKSRKSMVLRLRL